MDFPSVLERFSDIMQQVKGKQLAVFLDYDGASKNSCAVEAR